MSNSTKTTDLRTLSQYKALVAQSLTRLYQAKQIGKGIKNLACTSGLPTPVITDVNVTFEIEETTPVVADGRIKFDDLSKDAQERILASELEAYQRRLYDDLRCQIDRGNLLISEVIAVLTELGLPTPSVETTIAGIVFENGESHYLDLVVEGEVTEEQAQEKFNSVSEGSPSRRLALAAFPGARVTSQLAQDVRVSTRRTWPSSETIKVPVPSEAQAEDTNKA